MKYKSEQNKIIQNQTPLPKRKYKISMNLTRQFHNFLKTLERKSITYIKNANCLKRKTIINFFFYHKIYYISSVIEYLLNNKC